MTHRVAYVMSRFPHVPETFILREMTELSRQGWPVSLYPLILQKQVVIHEEAKAWLPRARVVPFLSSGVVAANLRTARSNPRLYASLWRRVAWENRTNPGFLARALLLFPKAIRIARLMKEEGIAHVHAHYATHPALVAWLIYRIAGIPYSVTVHAHDIFVRKEMLATKLRDASLIVSISAFNREYLATEVGEWVRGKIRVIHCGIEPERYRPSERSTTGGERLEIVAIGSLQPYKGHQYLLRACALLRRRGIPFRCRILGEGEERRRLERLLAEEGLSGEVELPGAQTQAEIAALLPTADCFVQPSVITASGKMEGIPVALMEAMASGLPVVATKISGVPELVEDGRTGYLVRPEDPIALAGAIEEIYRDPVEAARRAAEGRQRVLRHFDLRRNVAELAAAFEEINIPAHRGYHA